MDHCFEDFTNFSSRKNERMINIKEMKGPLCRVDMVLNHSGSRRKFDVYRRFPTTWWAYTIATNLISFSILNRLREINQARTQQIKQLSPFEGLFAMQFLLLFEIKQPAFELRCIEIGALLKTYYYKIQFSIFNQGVLSDCISCNFYC